MATWAGKLLISCWLCKVDALAMIQGQAGPSPSCCSKFMELYHEYKISLWQFLTHEDFFFSVKYNKSLSGYKDVQIHYLENWARSSF